MSESPPAELPEGEKGLEILSRRRLVLILVVLIAEIGLFFAGLLTPLSDASRQTLINQTSSQFGNVEMGSTLQLTVFIFSHNVLIALFEMIPVLGALLFAISVFSTGLAAQALVASQGLPAQWGAVIFVFPYSIVELTAYAVALVSGFMLISAWRGGRLRKELRVFAIEGLAVASILLIAAAMEAATLRISYVLGLALWLPTGLALGGIIIFATRRQK